MPRKLLRPPIKLRRRYAALIELCHDTIITSPAQTSGTEGGSNSHTSILLAWPVKIGVSGKLVPDYRDGIPAGIVVKIVEGNPTHAIVRHSCFTLLQHFKDKGYVSYNASDLFRMRLPTMLMICKMELGLDKLLEGIVDFEPQV